MKYIRLIILSIVVFFALACIVSFFIPSRIRVFRMTSIAKGRDSILNQVRDISQWKNWYPGFDKIELTEQQVVDGRVVKARAKDIIVDIKESSDSTVIVHMQRGSRPVKCGWQINNNNRNDSLALQTYMDFDLKWYPWEKFSSLMLDKGYGERMQEGLANLKNR
ncbi:hypothetical protein [Niabella ginsengisoli]|uniref:Polyketide cyclase n=1 Tax=Niabella ginsengisoli TaxID=522298 RepID=A0ABS9SL88_9BACT|nr:hypothetical protein [Niabella ginsengisoli]MCH5599102.1 hypothetical protein [Niabella ginsengisoli]